MSEVKRGYVRPLDIRHGRIDLSHGSGGRAMAQLIEELFAAAFRNPWLDQRNDQACLDLAKWLMMLWPVTIRISAMPAKAAEVTVSPSSLRV